MYTPFWTGQRRQYGPTHGIRAGYNKICDRLGIPQDRGIRYIGKWIMILMLGFAAFRYGAILLMIRW